MEAVKKTTASVVGTGTHTDTIFKSLVGAYTLNNYSIDSRSLGVRRRWSRWQDK